MRWESIVSLLVTFAVASLFTHDAWSTQETQSERLRFEPPLDAMLEVEVTEDHALVLTTQSKRIGEADPVVDRTGLRLWSGTKAKFVEGRDPKTGHGRRAYLPSTATLQLGQPKKTEDVDGERGPKMLLNSALAGVGVGFVPADGKQHAGGLARHYDTARAGREGLLPELTGPLDWGLLLTADGSLGAGSEAAGPRAAEGSTWDVDPAALELLLAPAGMLDMRGDRATDPRMLRSFDAGIGGNLQRAFDGPVKGTAKAVVRSIEADANGDRTAVIDIDFALRTTSDQTQPTQERRGVTREEGGADVVSASLRLELEGKATLRWSLGRHLPKSVEVAAEESVAMQVVLRGLAGAKVVQSTRMTGTLAVTSTVRSVAPAPSDRAQ